MKKILLIIVLLILTGCAVKKQKKLIYEQNTQIFLLDKQVQLLKRDIEDKKSIISAYRARLGTMQQEMNQLRDSRDSLLSKQRL
jgi:peptidoglycan hydrolase CwlO-like protein